MNTTFSEDLYLTNETGKMLYHKYAKDLPIIDYHCHLLASEICENKVFEDLGEIWLAHDHYKWRAMRTFGIDEKYITGNASYYEKYMEFAKILPYLAGNPIYIWCALELKRYFDIDTPLTGENAEEIFHKTKEIIEKEQITPRWCMTKSKVELVSTTEDPIDTLESHRKIKDENFTTKVITAFRPDKAFYIEKHPFVEYIEKLGKVAETTISTFSDLLDTLEQRLLFFKKHDTMISDAGIEDFQWEDYTDLEIEDIFCKGLRGTILTKKEIAKYRSAFLLSLGRLYYKHDFVMQLHIGTYQGANKGKEKEIGAACGFDCTDDSTFIKSVGEILDRLTKEEKLPRTLLYPLDSKQIEPFAILAAAFCNNHSKARVQLGAPWWFNDQSHGIKRQFDAISNLYPVSLSVGMLTDSRSFFSYPRHELYRRIFCNFLGELVERGEYFSGETYLAEMIRKVCYENVKEYFGFVY